MIEHIACEKQDDVPDAQALFFHHILKDRQICQCHNSEDDTEENLDFVACITKLSFFSSLIQIIQMNENHVICWLTLESGPREKAVFITV